MAIWGKSEMGIDSSPAVLPERRKSGVFHTGGPEGEKKRRSDPQDWSENRGTANAICFVGKK